MYDYISGRIVNKGTNYIVIDNNGIGYRIYTSSTTLENLAGVDKESTVFTHLYLREAIMDLYGFSTKEELAVFELLITVSGVGPKAAISLLSTISPSSFSLAVISDDIKELTKAPGIGKKLAQKIILELKDKLKKDQLVKDPIIDIAAENNGSVIKEAVDALMVLGYTSMEANKAVVSVYEKDMELEETVRNALKIMASGR